MDFKNLKPSVDFKDPATLCTLGGCVILLFASFLPIVKVLGDTESLMGGNHHGILHLILVIAIAALVVFNLEKIASGVMAAEIIWAIWDIRSVGSDVSDANKLYKAFTGENAASLQIAFYLLIIGAIALVAGLVLIGMRSKKSTQAPAQPMM